MKEFGCSKVAGLYQFFPKNQLVTGIFEAFILGLRCHKIL